SRARPSSPPGCLCTLGVLTYGLISFKRGNTRQSQLMMRARILAQGFTFAALLGGMVVTALKSRQ
ncbi:HIG2A protein, partial [Neodrepanis coruscans]|nr:HIG2A protein [Neodrepanis coruscans]